jgi:hypothetical protein
MMARIALDPVEIEVLRDWHLDAIPDALARTADRDAALWHATRAAQLDAAIGRVQAAEGQRT